MLRSSLTESYIIHLTVTQANKGKENLSIVGIKLILIVNGKRFNANASTERTSARHEK